MKSITACGFHCFAAGSPVQQAHRGCGHTSATESGLPEAKVVCHPPKLLDILLQENIEWPSGMVWCVQDDDGEIKFSSDSGYIPSNKDADGIWHRGFKGGGDTTVHGYPVSDDWSKTIISYKEYKQAKELYDNQNNQIASSDRDNSDISWFEKGVVPAIGTVCEAYLEGLWIKVEVLKNRTNDAGMEVAAVMNTNTFEMFWSVDFRPLKTGQEVKREKAIEDMSRIMHDKGYGSVINDVTLGALLDAGYHKD